MLDFLFSKIKAFPSLFEDLLKIQIFCKELWRQKLMIWFTNHDYKHSEEVIYILGQILKPLEPYEKEFLNEHELFILLSSAYLHDIGMQSLKIDNNISIDQLTTQHYNYIRKKHAEESFNIIMRSVIESINRDEIHLPKIDVDYIPYIALISKGHSTDYYDEVINLFQSKEYNTIKNRDIRGKFLTSLLMFADELDLTRNRVDMTLLEQINLSNLSKIHWFKHYYTQKIYVSNKTIYIQLVFSDNSNNYKSLFEKMIRDKLEEQLNRINKILAESTNGLLSFNNKIEISSTINRYISNRQFPIELLEDLKKQVFSKDPKPIKEALKEYIENKKAHKRANAFS